MFDVLLESPKVDIEIRGREVMLLLILMIESKHHWNLIYSWLPTSNFVAVTKDKL